MISHWTAYTIRIVGYRAAQYPELGRWKDRDNEGLVFIRFPGGDGAWFAPEECVDTGEADTSSTGLRDAIVDALQKLPEDTTWGIPVRDGVRIIHDDAALLRLLDMACARALGTRIRPEDIEANNHRRVFPPYSSDPAAARVLDDEVKRIGIAHEYAAALYGIVTHHYLTHEGATPDEIVLLVFATPEQRCMAFLEVMKGQQIHANPR